MNRQIKFLLTFLIAISFHSVMLEAMGTPVEIAVISEKDQEQQLIDAIKNGDLDLVKQIFSHGNIKPDTILKNKGPALMFAAAAAQGTVQQDEARVVARVAARATQAVTEKAVSKGLSKL